MRSNSPKRFPSRCSTRTAGSASLICWTAVKFDATIMSTLRVNLGPRSYDIAIVTGDPMGIGPFARDRAAQTRLAYLVTDTNVTSHAAAVETALVAAGFRTAGHTIPAGEASKTLAV